MNEGNGKITVGNLLTFMSLLVIIFIAIQGWNTKMLFSIGERVTKVETFLNFYLKGTGENEFYKSFNLEPVAQNNYPKNRSK